MKKLLGTTALVAAAFATAPAMAADKIKAKVGGYMVHQVAAVFDIDQTLAAGQDDRSFSFGQEGEVHFKGSTTLDNGIEVGFKAELELADDAGGTGSNGNGIDEAYIYVEGAFGEFQMGDQDGVGDQMPVVAPSPFLETFANDTDLDPLGSVGTSPNTVVDNSSDDTKVIYFTPRLAGFQAGISYAPENSDIGWTGGNTGLVKDDNTDENQFELGLTYENSFNEIDLAASFVYYTNENGRNAGAANSIDEEDWALGASVGFAGFTVGGSYSEKETGGTVNAANNAIAEDRDDWGVGATYGTGPWTFGLEYAEANRDAVGGAGEIDTSAYIGGVGYSLGGGVNVSLGYLHKEDDVANQEGSAIFTEFGIKF